MSWKWQWTETIPWLCVLFLSWNTNTTKSQKLLQDQQIQNPPGPSEIPDRYKQTSQKLWLFWLRVTQRVSGEEGNPPVWAHYCCSTSRGAAIASVLEHFQSQVSRTFSDSSERPVTFATAATLTLTQWHFEITGAPLPWKALLSFL